MPRHNNRRRKGEGKSRPELLPTHLGSRSKVIWRGHPYVCKKLITVSIAVCSRKSSLACAHNAMDVPASTKLHTSTTCLCLPSEPCAGNTLLTSLKSIWISSNGSRGSNGFDFFFPTGCATRLQ